MSSNREPKLWPLAAEMAALAIAFLFVAKAYVTRYKLPLASAAGIYCCFVVLLFCVIAPAYRVVPRGVARPLSLLLFAYLPYALGTGDFRWTACVRLIAIAGLPFLLYGFIRVRTPERFTWQDLLVAVWLVSMVLFHLFDGIWKVPAKLDFLGRLYVAAVGLFAWTSIRPVPDLNYELAPDRRCLAAALRGFVYFAVIAIPAGFVLRFTSWNPQWHGAGDFLASFLEILLFVALLEEVFFRGFLQNLLEKTLNSPLLGRLIASVVFGLFHILHAPFPNWRYVILATIAGWFYGGAYRSGGTLLSSMLVHASVDTVWRAFLTRPHGS